MNTPLLEIEAANHRRTLTDTHAHRNTYMHADRQTDRQTRICLHSGICKIPSTCFIICFTECPIFQLSAGKYWTMWRNYLEGCRVSSDTLFRSFFWKKVIVVWHEQVDWTSHPISLIPARLVRSHTEP